MRRASGRPEEAALLGRLADAVKREFWLTSALGHGDHGAVTKSSVDKHNIMEEKRIRDPWDSPHMFSRW